MDYSFVIAIIPVILVVAFIGWIAKKITDGERLDMKEGVLGVIILMVAVIVIASMMSNMDREFEVYDCVPVSSFGSGITIEGDCAEIVTIGDKEYVRMTDLGTFSVKSGNRTTEYTVTKAHMDLIVLSGQSNSGCYFTNPSFYSGETTIAPGKGFYLGTEAPSSQQDGGNLSESNLSSSTICDVVASDGSMRLAAMYPALYGDYYKETGHRLMTVSTGIGGRFISAWDDGQRADVFMENGLERLKAQCEGKIDLTVVAVLWTQGEADAGHTEAFYSEHFQPLLQKLENGDYAGYKFPHITASLPRRNMASIDDMIPPALAQISIAETDPHFSIASSLAYRATEDQMRDEVHFTQEYYGWIGEAFARKLAQLTGYRPVSETIVLGGDAGVVGQLPSKVDAYGTSGNAYSLNVRWTESSTSGQFSGSMSGNPSGTTILDGLTAAASYWSYEDGLLTIGRSVSGSGNAWDGYSATTTDLVLKDTVTSVSGSAFSSFAGLESVSVPSSIQTISSSCFGVAFRDAYGDAIAIGPGEYMGPGSGSVYKADASIFSYSEDGTTITGLAQGASAAKYLVIPRLNDTTEITAIGVAQASGEVFFGNTTIAFLGAVRDSGITEIGGNAFRGCSSLADVVLPPKLETIGGNALRECAFTTVDLPATMKVIGTFAFYQTPLTSIEIPSGVTEVAVSAFRNCASLQAVEMPSTVQTVGAQAFGGCSGITTITFETGFSATLDATAFSAWTFYAADGTTVLDKTIASNLAGHTFTGTASALVLQS